MDKHHNTMKSAQTWADEMNHGCARHKPDQISIEEIKQIQADVLLAFREIDDPKTKLLVLQLAQEIYPEL